MNEPLKTDEPNPALARVLDLEIEMTKIRRELETINSWRDLDATTKNRVTNLLQRTEPRIALIEEVLLEEGRVYRTDNGEIAKVPPKPMSEKKIKRIIKETVEGGVVKEQPKTEAPKEDFAPHESAQ